MDKRNPVLFGPTDGQYVGWLGHTLRYLALGEDTGGRYCLSSTHVPSGGGAKPHRHQFEEAFYVLSGRAKLTAGNQSVELAAGEFIHISGGSAHAPSVVSDDGADILTLAAPAGFDRFQMEAGERLQTASQTPTKSIEDVRQAIDKIAPKFDIDMHPPDKAFCEDPICHVTRLSDGEIVDAVGDRYRFLAEGEHTQGLYALWHATISPGGGPPPHTHSREEEAFYVLRGELTFEADGQIFVGGPGSFVNLPISSRHRFSNQTDQPAEVLILVAPAGLEKMFRKTGQLVTDPSSPISSPSLEDKERLARFAPDFGIALG